MTPNNLNRRLALLVGLVLSVASCASDEQAAQELQSGGPLPLEPVVSDSASLHTAQVFAGPTSFLALPRQQDEGGGLPAVINLASGAEEAVSLPSVPTGADGTHLAQMSAVAIADNQWIIGGTSCSDPRTVDTASCAPGTYSMYWVADEDGWAPIDVALAPLNSAQVLLEGFIPEVGVVVQRLKEGLRTYWVVDPEGAGAQEVDWTPPSDFTEEDFFAGKPIPLHSSCVAGEYLLVLHQHSEGATTQVTSVKLARDGGTEEVMTADLPDTVAPTAILCSSTGQVAVVAKATSSNEWTAIELDAADPAADQFEAQSAVTSTDKTVVNVYRGVGSYTLVVNDKAEEPGQSSTILSYVVGTGWMVGTHNSAGATTVYSTDLGRTLIIDSPDESAQ